MKHNHRIIPGYMGGKYSENNVIRVEVVNCNMHTANHIMWHYANWLLWGNWEDFIASKALAGYYSKEEIIQEAMRMAREKIDRKAIGKALRKKFNDNPELREERSKQIKEAFERLESSDPGWREKRRKAIAKGGGWLKGLNTRRLKGMGMFDKDWQREMGARGGRKVVEMGVGIMRPDVIKDPERKARGGRSSMLKRQGLKINGVMHYPQEFEHRTHLSSDFVDYYIKFGLSVSVGKV